MSPFVKTCGVSFSYSHQTQYIYYSNQAGQLSHFHSLATTNRKLAIFVLMSISGIIKLQINSYSSKKKQVVHTKLVNMMPRY